MKFLHISDLHIGKRVNEFSMIEGSEIYFTADQRDRIGKTGGCGYDRGGYL